ncbi:hypothetical protein BJV78DRAFT_1277562 [Lactifluus subvellereus]|nr:hypothetical protein BJV78DRAFT_1277562 [Lactifluus subvellereus]
MIKIAKPCDEGGEYLLPFMHPPAPPDPPEAATNPWNPFKSRIEFDFAHYHFIEVQNSAPLIDKALDLWAATVMEFGGDTLWKNSKELYATIDMIQRSDSPWKTYELCARDTHQVLHHQLGSTWFKDGINLTPYQQFDGNGQRVWSNLMSADWAWTQATEIAEDESTHGSMFVPIIAGSDKTTVSVATGQQEYHPVYMSPGNLTNPFRRGHSNALLPVAFLPIPKTTKNHRKSTKYQVFCRQMYHACLAHIFQPLKAGMTTPEVVVYGLGPYIADYPEQVWLAAIVQGWCPNPTEFLINNWDAGTLWTDFGVHADIVPFTSNFPRADIHQLLSPDLLHQVIKGTFKDHIVMWVNEYLLEAHGETQGVRLLRTLIIGTFFFHLLISATPAFPGLRRFPDGRDFAQWTGDDSKALMKVYLTAVAGHVPSEVVKCLSAFLNFCYIARRNAITSDALDELQNALDRFHHYQSSLGLHFAARQHSLLHYVRSIRLFGSPNGLCSSITESKHIKAVKEPWRRLNHFNAIVQMLQTLCRLDKLAAVRREFAELGMMDGSTAILSQGLQLLMKTMTMLRFLVHNSFTLFKLLRHFLFTELNPDADILPDDIPLDQCPYFNRCISVYHSAVSRFFAPSDLCSAGGMYQERIRSNPNWRDERSYPCALVMWFIPGDEPDEDTGMWVVRPEFHGNGRRTLTIIHLGCIARAAHLLPVFGTSFVPDELHFSDSLDVYRAYFVNNNVDHHCHEFLS